ncbi:MAG: MBL fold metallo-hydrolase, partial [Candidatus Adiutrix sp.]
ETTFLAGEGLGFFAWMGLDNPKTAIGRTLDEGPWELGDKTLDLYLTPGHTPGSLCIHYPEAGVLITGDVLFAHSVGRTDFPGGDHQQLAASIDKLANLPNVEVVLPGHGPAIIGAAKVAENFEIVKRHF